MAFQFEKLEVYQKALEMIKWSESSDISIPSWVIARQSEFQSHLYVDEAARMDFVLAAAETNAKLTGAAPLAAAVFMEDGALISIGVDAVGIGGHEMTNALIMASNMLGSQSLRDSSSWSLYSLAPPCLVCLGNISNERPYQFVCAVNHEDMVAALQLPNTLMPEPNWISVLESRGIVVKSAIAREQGKKILQHTEALY